MESPREKTLLNCRAEGHEPLANAEAYYEATLSLPMYVGLSEADVAQIAAAVKDVLAP